MELYTPMGWGINRGGQSRGEQRGLTKRGVREASWLWNGAGQYNYLAEPCACPVQSGLASSVLWNLFLGICVCSFCVPWEHAAGTLCQLLSSLCVHVGNVVPAPGVRPGGWVPLACGASDWSGWGLHVSYWSQQGDWSRSHWGRKSIRSPEQLLGGHEWGEQGAQCGAMASACVAGLRVHVHQQTLSWTTQRLGKPNT